MGTFIVKCLLIMRQRYPIINGQDQIKWEMILKNIKLLESSTNSKNLNSLIDSLECISYLCYGHNVNLFKLECLKRWEYDLKPRFENLIDDFYSTKNGFCSKIIFNHFKGGKEETDLEKGILSLDFRSYLNRDLLLAYLWKYQDFDLWNKCDGLKKNLESYSNTEEEMEKFKSNRNRMLTLVFSSSFIPNLKSDLELFFRGNHKISSYSLDSENDHYLNLLEIINESYRLTWKNLLNVIDFGDINEISKHLKLKNLSLWKLKNSTGNYCFLYIKAIKLCNEYEEEMEEMILKTSNDPNLKHLQYEKYYERVLGNLSHEYSSNSEFIKENKLEFNRITFLENLYEAMMKFKSFSNFTNNHNLPRLFFKWVIYMNGKLEDIKKNKYELSETIGYAYEQLEAYLPSFISNYYIYDYFYNFESNLGNQNLSKLEQLFHLEIEERTDEMKAKLKHALDTFYDPGPNQGDCYKLRKLCFNGRFENDIVLAFIIWKLERPNSCRECMAPFSISCCIMEPNENYGDNLKRKPIIDFSIIPFKIINQI